MGKGVVFYILVGSLFLMLGCKCSRKESPDDKNGLQENLSGFNRMEEMKDVYYRFPSPDEMFSYIESEGLQFDNSLLMPVKGAEKFLNSRSQSLGMGIYIADLAYITLFENYKESMKYFEIIYNLSEKLRISSAFNKNLIKRIEKNINNIDSLKSISDESFTSISNYLVQNDKEKVFAVISIGGFIEALYIAINLVDKADSGSTSIERVAEQKLVLENLIRYSEVYSSDDNVNSCLKMIKPVQDIFNSLTIERGETVVLRNTDGSLIIKGGDRIKISKTEFKELSDAVTKIRLKIAQDEI